MMIVVSYFQGNNPADYALKPNQTDQSPLEGKRVSAFGGDIFFSYYVVSSSREPVKCPNGTPEVQWSHDLSWLLRLECIAYRLRR